MSIDLWQQRLCWKDSGSVPPGNRCLWDMTAALSPFDRHGRGPPVAVTEDPDETVKTRDWAKVISQKGQA
jgi:hypothetical protein